MTKAELHQMVDCPPDQVREPDKDLAAGLLFPASRSRRRWKSELSLAQRELAARGHHRLAPIDVMIAACAHED
jgi:hypothetical protein